MSIWWEYVKPYKYIQIIIFIISIIYLFESLFTQAESWWF